MRVQMLLQGLYLLTETTGRDALKSTRGGPQRWSLRAMNADWAGQAVLITCQHDAVLLLKWLKKFHVRAVCTSVNAYLLLCAEGLRNRLELIDSPLPGDKANEIGVTAERLARRVDSEITQCLAETTGLPITQGWDFWDKLLFVKSVLPVVEWLRTHSLQHLPDRLAICFFANTQDYFHPSRIRSQIFADALRRAGKRVAKIPIECPFPPPYIPGVWRSSFRTSAHHLQGSRLVHLPSTFYAQAELAERYGSDEFLALESPFYETVLHGRRIELDRSSPVVRDLPFDANVPRGIYQTFLKELGLAELDGISLQLDHWLERLAFQFRAFKMLAMLREKYGVSLAALSDHDGGLFGPVCSAFHDQSEPITIFPHSTICVGPLPRLPSDVIGVMQSVRPLEPFDGAPLPAPTLVRGSPKAPDAGGKFVIVLNGIDDACGLPVHRLGDLLDFVEALAAALLARGLKPILRARPSTPVQAHRKLGIEIWDGDLGELISGSAACIGVGQVTSALTRFWCAGVPCVHIQDRKLDLYGSYLLPAKGVEWFVGRPFMEALPQVLGFVDGLVASARSASLR